MEFQSTHPARGATMQADGFQTEPPFQSTHPARGATRPVLQDAPPLSISIHAPRKGCDQEHFQGEIILPDFNPRTPQGVRQIYSNYIVLYVYNFNPRTPQGVRLRRVTRFRLF